MQFFTEAVNVLKTLVIALGAGLAVWGVVNLLEGYGNDNPGRKCLCLVKKQNQNTSIDSSLPLFRSLKELAKICYNFQNSRTFDVAKPLYIMKGGLERYGFGRTI